MDTKAWLIVLLLAVVGVLSYLLYESQKSGVSINLPGVKIDAK